MSGRSLRAAADARVPSTVRPSRNELANEYGIVTGVISAVGVFSANARRRRRVLLLPPARITIGNAGRCVCACMRLNSSEECG